MHFSPARTRNLEPTPKAFGAALPTELPRHPENEKLGHENFLSRLRRALNRLQPGSPPLFLSRLFYRGAAGLFGFQQALFLGLLLELIAVKLRLRGAF